MTGSSKPADRWGGYKEFFQDQGFLCVPDVFMKHHSRLAGKMSPGQAMFLLHLMSFKWTADAPYPSNDTLGARMGLSSKAVQRIAAELEKMGYLKRIPKTGSSNRFDLSGLFAALKTAHTREQDEKK